MTLREAFAFALVKPPELNTPADAAAGQAFEQSRYADLEFALAAREAHLAELFLESSATGLRARADRLLDNALQAADLARYHVRLADVARRQGPGL